jgi:hypothetical protein
MDGLRNPVGDQPPQVYWKRRLVVVIGIVIVVIVLGIIISKVVGGGDAATPEQTSEASTSTSPEPETSGSADAISRACGSTDLTITTTANPSSVPEGALPVFDVGLEQTGSSACMLDTAADGTELLITSGEDRIYSSTDCPDDETIAATQLLLEPGSTESVSVTWNRQRSLPDCATETAEPGAGTYKAALTVQGITSEPATFTLE